MSEPAASILGSDLIQSVLESLVQVLAGTSTDSAQEGLQLGESPFNGREIGRIRRQKPHVTAFRLDGLANLGTGVGAQIIQHHDLTGLQTGN